MIAPTLLGHIGAVAGASVSVRQYEGMASGIAIIGGRSYRVGQVGSFVRIPQGYHDLYGIISDVGATATPETLKDVGARGDRWMTVQLVGEVIEATFERGVSQYPAINDQVHLVVEEDLGRIYGNDATGQVTIGRLSGAESIPVRVDLDKLVTRHSAVLGSTGSGKSTTVASLLRSISMGHGTSEAFPSARVLLIDIHGEYGKALKSVAKVFRVTPYEGESPLFVPYWALDLNELLPFLLGKTEEKPLTAIHDKILAAKAKVADVHDFPGIDKNSLTAGSPIPFSLKALWSELIDPEIKTWKENTQINSAIAKEGDAETLSLPEYPLPGIGGASPFANKTNVLSIRRQLDLLRSRLLDKQYDFMLHPGDWEPNLLGITKNDLPQLLEAWVGHEKPITVLDLSGVPSTVLMRLIGAVLTMEEAHRYLNKETDSPARDAVQRIVKEGRKFGIGAMIVSQRPSEIDDTILSQCGTFFALRLSNAADRSKVQAALPDSLSGIVDSLPVLRTGEAVITGEAAKLPVRCRITLPMADDRPSSEDPLVANAWAKTRSAEDYGAVAATWRSQNPRWKPEGK
jgi:hypothetical protein